MAAKGKTQLLITFVATPDQVDELDRLVASHGAWMAKSHARDGATGLLSYNFSKGPEWPTRSIPDPRPPATRAR